MLLEVVYKYLTVVYDIHVIFSYSVCVLRGLHVVLCLYDCLDVRM